MKEVYNILKEPIILSEKSTQMRTQNKYTFIVDKNANKIQIKKAIEEIYKVKVKKVNVLYVRGKRRLGYSPRTRRIAGKTSDFKKAIVTLQEGHTISEIAT